MWRSATKHRPPLAVIQHMSKLFYIGIFCLIFLSFKYENIETQEGEPFFSDYNQVLHFKYIISKEEADKYLFDREENDKDYPNCLFNKLPQKLDASLAENLFDLGFIRNEIKKNKFQKLDEIFSYRFTADRIFAECQPVYRDILIFRNKKTVKGIVQICFACSQFVFIGTNVETSSFGQQNQPSELEALLYPN